MKRALILSGGGLFGAWQVGAWSVLRDHMDFDVVIGVSIGSLNGWAVAGGATPEHLAAKWVDAMARGRLRFKFPLRPLDGIVDFSQIEGFIRDIHSSYTLRLEYHAVVTDLVRLKPRMIEGSHVHWRHLAASCALFGILPQQRIDSVLYTDGGLLGALPLWTAKKVKATHVVGLNVMPKMPWPVRAALKSLHYLSKRQEQPGVENVVVLSPSRPLGGLKAAAVYQHARIPEWIEQGKQDAAAAIREKNISFPECFEA